MKKSELYKKLINNKNVINKQKNINCIKISNNVT
jgi:hypothetical protein